VAHTCNPSYSGGRDQEDQGSKAVWAHSSRDHILKKKTHHKKGLVERPLQGKLYTSEERD
jgi:hypothetical protein